MAMLPNKFITLCLRSHIPCYSSLRYVRGGYTIEVKKPTRKVKLSKKEKLRRLYEIEDANVGIGSALHIIEERKGYLDPELDEHDIDEITFGVENINSKFKDNIK